MAYTQNLGYQKAPSYTDWQQYGTWQNEPVSASEASRANYDNYINKQAGFQASGDIDSYNNNLKLHGLYQETPPGEQLQFDIYAQQQADEAARQARIQHGTRLIDQQFSQFNDNFYNQRRDAYMNWANPQLDTQYQDNTRQLAYALARAGTTNSSSAAQKQADLQRMYDEGKAKLANTGLGYASQARADVAAQRANAYGQLNATSGAENAATQAGSAAALQAASLRDTQPIYDTMGDFFYGLTPGIGQGIGAAGNAAVQGYQNSKGPAIGDINRTGNETVR